MTTERALIDQRNELAWALAKVCDVVPAYHWQYSRDLTAAEAERIRKARALAEQHALTQTLSDSDPGDAQP